MYEVFYYECRLFNLKKLKEYLEQNATDSKGNLIVFQAGSGRLSLFNAPGGGFTRAIIAPVILPVGILTSFIGVPLFLFLLIRKKTI